MIKENIRKIESALLKKDLTILKEYLHQDLTIGHSNGWIENKESLFEDLVQDKVTYSRFESIGDVVFTYKSDNLIITRRDINAYGIVDSYEFIAKLNILEIWNLQDNNWKLLARQSVSRKEQP